MITTHVFLLDCEHGCPPIHQTLRVKMETCAQGHQHMSSTEEGNRLLELATVAHMKQHHG